MAGEIMSVVTKINAVETKEFRTDDGLTVDVRLKNTGPKSSKYRVRVGLPRYNAYTGAPTAFYDDYLLPSADGKEVAAGATALFSNIPEAWLCPWRTGSPVMAIKLEEYY